LATGCHQRVPLQEIIQETPGPENCSLRRTEKLEEIHEVEDLGMVETVAEGEAYAQRHTYRG